MPVKVSEIFVQHVDHRYVNLELIEPALKQKAVTCYLDASLDSLTHIELDFATSPPFELAKAAWKSDGDYLFVVEGEHCFMGAGERSFFRYRSVALHLWHALTRHRSKEIVFNITGPKITIKAYPLMAHLFAGNEWRTHFNLTHFYLPDDQRAVPRPSSGWIFGRFLCLWLRCISLAEELHRR